MGIPYRRGYLFYGYPGTGKSSFIFALAGELMMSICVIRLNDKDMNDDQLNDLLNSAPPSSILLIEDVDAAFTVREGNGINKVTFSGLLNALDGVASQEGRITFMTTNKMELLDPALIRPGRVDVITQFGLATQYQIGEMFSRFFPLIDEDVKNSFISQVPEGTLSMAELQGYLLKCRNDINKAMNHLSELKNLNPNAKPKKQ